jgi:adenylosuccinate synthase
MISIVVGIGFGDEGKGVVTANLVKEANDPLVVRFNGGHQAGHTVVKDGHRHVFSSFGSGTLHGAPTYWSKFCTVYPHALLSEYKLLKEFNPVLYIDPMCPITTPFDVISNQVTNKHGSVGVGFGETIRRQESHYTLYAKDLKYKDVLNFKLDMIKRYYNCIGYQSEVFEFLEDVKEMLSIVSVGKPNHTGDFIYEGAQGILLDQRFGFFPHVTRSNTTSQNALELINGIPTIYLVTRAYQTRHGLGPMTNEHLPIEVDNEGETNVFNPNQGNFRIAPFDDQLIQYAIECEEQISDYPKKIVMTCCDQVKDIPKIWSKYPIIYNDSPEGNFTKYDHIRRLA